MKSILLANLIHLSYTVQCSACNIEWEEHAAHVTIICCGALCAIVVVCNETEWEEVYL